MVLTLWYKWGTTSMSRCKAESNYIWDTLDLIYKYKGPHCSGSGQARAVPWQGSLMLDQALCSVLTSPDQHGTSGEDRSVVPVWSTCLFSVWDKDVFRLPALPYLSWEWVSLFILSHLRIVSGECIGPTPFPPLEIMEGNVLSEHCFVSKVSFFFSSSIYCTLRILSGVAITRSQSCGRWGSYHHFLENSMCHKIKLKKSFYLKYWGHSHLEIT